jgi:transcriptional regulator with PAS, ATPase and Fis domain
MSEDNDFKKCLEAANLAARSSAPVLVTGETGVGKEVIARLVHEQSARANKPMIAINCGALPDSLVESELFGHARGTFTGAHRDREGLFEAAEGGTVLLDEIGELPSSAQVKLLRFLDSGEYRRIGETRAKVADVRIVAATNRKLEELASRGRFRTDLLYRLNVFQVDVPPLRTRRRDVLALTDFFLTRTSRSGQPPCVTSDLRTWILDYEWPGNVRELKNLCEYLVTKTWGRDLIDLSDLPDHLQRIQISPGGTESLSRFERQKKQLEREQIIEALKASDGKIIQAARLLRMSRNTVAHRIKEYDITQDLYRS